jgi:hypothetical protein
MSKKDVLMSYERALELLELAQKQTKGYSIDSDVEYARALVLVAQVNATLAMAEQLERIAVALEGRIEVRTQTERNLEAEVARAAEAHERRSARDSGLT